MEGWFRWRAGATTLRDHTSAGGTGWLLPFDSGGNLCYRVGGSGFNTGQPVDSVRDGEWHHLVATKSAGSAALYVDGVLVHSGSGAGSDAATSPWHVMRNGTNAVFSEGKVDEIALYTRALGADEVKAHYDLARALANAPLPPDGAPPPPAEPPAAGTGRDGGVLDLPPAAPGGTSSPPATVVSGSVLVRGRRLVVRGAAGRTNRFVVRRRGGFWRARDAAAPLAAGRGCRQVAARVVDCRTGAVKRIVVYGGAGDDRPTVSGRINVRFVGGPGRDILVRRRR
jgi:hypothetical protein